jgi:hypothetical protein
MNLSDRSGYFASAVAASTPDAANPRSTPAIKVAWFITSSFGCLLHAGLLCCPLRNKVTEDDVLFLFARCSGHVFFAAPYCFVIDIIRR